LQGHLSSEEAAERKNNEGATEDITNPNYDGKTGILIDSTDNDLLFAVKKETVVKE